jgi:hypothetical protein
MDSETKTLLPSLINYINSDLFTLSSISTSMEFNKAEDSDPTLINKWGAVISYLPLKFYQIIESYPDMIQWEEFDHKYTRNPKMFAYEKYGSTNMWRPIMILNRCPSIINFDFEYIRCYNIQTFSQVLSVLISRVSG